MGCTWVNGGELCKVSRGGLKGYPAAQSSQFLCGHKDRADFRTPLIGQGHLRADDQVKFMLLGFGQSIDLHMTNIGQR